MSFVSIQSIRVEDCICGRLLYRVVCSRHMCRGFSRSHSDADCSSRENASKEADPTRDPQTSNLKPAVLENCIFYVKCWYKMTRVNKYHQECQRRRLCVAPVYPGHFSEWDYVPQHCRRRSSRRTHRPVASRQQSARTSKHEVHAKVLRSLLKETPAFIQFAVTLTLPTTMPTKIRRNSVPTLKSRGKAVSVDVGDGDYGIMEEVSQSSPVTGAWQVCITITTHRSFYF